MSASQRFFNRSSSVPMPSKTFKIARFTLKG